MKTHIKDALQILAALLMTGGMASAMTTPKPLPKPTNIVSAPIAKVEKPKPIKKKLVKKVVKKAVKHTHVAAKPVVKARVVPVSKPIVYSGSHQDWMHSAGIAPSDYAAVDFILSRESGWCATKWQGQTYCPATFAHIYVGDESDPYRGYGLCQSTPAIKMAVVGLNWRTDPVLQLKWCTIHSASHGGWWGSYNYWVAHHNW